MKNKIILVMWMMILLVNIVYGIGVSDVSPTYLELLPGESGRFVFQIQSVASPRDLRCAAGILGTSNLQIDFDQEITIVPAGEVRDVLATVRVPDDHPLGSVYESFCVSCGSNQPAAEGSSPVSFNSCGLKVRVDVVGERTKANMPLPQKPFVMQTWLLVLIVVMAILLIVTIIWFYSRRRKHKKK